MADQRLEDARDALFDAVIAYANAKAGYERAETYAVVHDRTAALITAARADAETPSEAPDEPERMANKRRLMDALPADRLGDLHVFEAQSIWRGRLLAQDAARAALARENEPSERTQ